MTNEIELPKTADVVIVGGGVMGASLAYHLALHGFAKIVLLERQAQYGLGATGKCAGGIRHQFGTEVNIRLSIESLKMLDRFEEETGQPVDIRHCGYLFMLTNEADMETFRRNVALQRSLGVLTEWLDDDEVRRRVPSIRGDDVIAGTFHPHDGLADPNGVVMGYVNRAKEMKARLFTNVEVTGIRLQSGRVWGVDTTAGHLPCSVVVNCAGPWAARVGTMVGLDLPIVPIRRQMLTTGPLRDLPPDFPFVIDFAQSLYFHREGEGLLTGMSNPNQLPGEDESVDEDWELVHLEAAVKRMPLLEKAGLAAHWAGLYEVTPDAHPIMGKTPVDGFYICAGFSGHGFMHGPVCGKLMAEILHRGRATTVDVSALTYDRFLKRERVREYNVV